MAALALQVLGVTDAATLVAGREAAIAYGLAIRAKTEADSSHVLAHVAGARSAATFDRRAIPVLLWSTLAEKRLASDRVPTFTLTWRALRGRY